MFETWFKNFSLSLKQTSCKYKKKLLDFDKGFEKLKIILKELKRKNGTVWWVGNGGSASICEHISQDLLNILKIKSMTISNTSLMTCISNDYGYENIYSKPLNLLIKKNDILICISSSGNSRNIINAVNIAKKIKIKTISFSAFSKTNKLWKKSEDLAFFVNTNKYGYAELSHFAILHSAIDTFKK